MRTIGTGSAAWRVRVDLFADDGEGWRVGVAQRLAELAVGDKELGDVGADQGTGASNRPVVGLLFWVRADGVGEAATAAVKIAREVGAEFGVGPELYDVTVIPGTAVVRPGDADYPPMPD